MTNARNITRKPIVIADHPVLDMLNTVAIVNKQQDDFWQTDEDVIYWLETVANIKLTSHKTFKQGELLKTARLLREVIRKLVVKKKADSLNSIKPIEPFLDASLSWISLQKNADGQWHQHQDQHNGKSDTQDLSPCFDHCPFGHHDKVTLQARFHSWAFSDSLTTIKGISRTSSLAPGLPCTIG